MQPGYHLLTPERLNVNRESYLCRNHFKQWFDTFCACCNPDRLLFLPRFVLPPGEQEEEENLYQILAFPTAFHLQRVVIRRLPNPTSEEIEHAHSCTLKWQAYARTVREQLLLVDCPDCVPSLMSLARLKQLHPTYAVHRLPSTWNPRFFTGYSHMPLSEAVQVVERDLRLRRCDCRQHACRGLECKIRCLVAEWPQQGFFDFLENYQTSLLQR